MNNERRTTGSSEDTQPSPGPLLISTFIARRGFCFRWIRKTNSVSVLVKNNMRTDIIQVVDQHLVSIFYRMWFWLILIFLNVNSLLLVVVFVVLLSLSYHQILFFLLLIKNYYYFFSMKLKKYTTFRKKIFNVFINISLSISQQQQF